MYQQEGSSSSEFGKQDWYLLQQVWGLEGQTTDEVGEGLSGMVRPPEMTPPAPCLRAPSVNRKRRVDGSGDPF